MALKFFHLPRSKRFNIPYRFYDPDKEDRDEREQRIKIELGIKPEHDPGKPFVSTLKGQFRQSMGRSAKTTEDARRSSNIRLMVLIALLVMLFYLFFYR